MRHEEVRKGAVEDDDLDVGVRFEPADDFRERGLHLGVVEVEGGVVEGHPPVDGADTLGADRQMCGVGHVFRHDGIPGAWGELGGLEPCRAASAGLGDQAR